ncbi:MAG: glucose-1-phosphate adenylyltransferase subunit GlgD [Clostridia bacterium]|nr:glucose-1-phosphate adenylyltransferase subunit GlgD [Clostridia bacterium]
MNGSNLFGIIYTGESNMQLRDLTYSRSTAAVPFGGRYRCIDFMLSAMVNTGITNVGIITQKNYHSLMDHLGSGKEWDLTRKRDGLFILPPFVTKENTGLYKGPVDALRSNLGYIRRSSQRYVVFTGSQTVYNTTYDAMLEQHIKTGADITIMYNEETEERGIGTDEYEDIRLAIDESGRVTDIEINPYRPQSKYRSCDCFIMEKTLLEYLVEEAASRANYEWTRDVIFPKLGSLKVHGFRYDGYVARLSSLTAYFKHTMALLQPEVGKDMFSTEHPVYTKIKDEVPALYGPNAQVKNSIVADGCVIDGEVENCVLFRGVRVGKGAKISNCILMQAVEVQSHCELDHVILDKGGMVKRGRKLMGHETCPIILRTGTIV